MVHVENPTGNLLIAELTGKVSGADYEKVLVPAVHDVIAEHGTVRMMVVIPEGFEGYEAEAAWDDAKLGARMWGCWERVAVATDVPWVATSIRLFAHLVSCPVRLFPGSGADDARRWLEESLGTVHASMEDGILHAKLIGELESSAYEGLGAEIDNLLAGQDGARLLVDLQEFGGWQNLSALGHHISLMFGHRHVIRRAALLGDASWQKVAVRFARHLLRGEARFFENEAEARAWLAEG